jgi:hypothetical protein
MQRIISLLKDKNNYLERFYEINETELSNFANRNFDGLESFYATRDSLLEMIREIDERIDKENRGANDQFTPTQNEKIEIELMLKEKNQWVKAILAQDLHILSSVEKEKSSIITELRSTARAKKVVGAYHSGTQTTQLDEEA